LSGTAGKHQASREDLLQELTKIFLGSQSNLKLLWINCPV